MKIENNISETSKQDLTMPLFFGGYSTLLYSTLLYSTLLYSTLRSRFSNIFKFIGKMKNLQENLVLLYNRSYFGSKISDFSVQENDSLDQVKCSLDQMNHSLDQVNDSLDEVSHPLDQVNIYLVNKTILLIKSAIHLIKSAVLMIKRMPDWIQSAAHLINKIGVFGFKKHLIPLNYISFTYFI